MLVNRESEIKMKNIIESLFGGTQNKAIALENGEYYGEVSALTECSRCGDEYEADEAEVHESGECLHRAATEGYCQEIGENYIFGDEERTRQFCMETMLGSGYPENIGAETREKIIALMRSRIELLRVLEREVRNIPKRASDSLWAAMGDFEYLNSYSEYKAQVREFCIGVEGIEEYAEWYNTTPASKLYGGAYGEWIDTNEPIAEAV